MSKNYELIDFNPLDIEKSEEIAIKEYEQGILKENSTEYNSPNSNFDDPVLFIDSNYVPDDIKSYSRVKNECKSNKEFYDNILLYAKEESPRSYELLKDRKRVFLKRLGIYECSS